MKLKILLNNYYDISDYVLEMPDLIESCVQNNFDNYMSFVVDNTKGIIDVDNPLSIFYGNPVTHFYITILDEDYYDTVIFEGQIKEVKPTTNHKGSIDVQSNLVRLDSILKTYANMTFFDIWKSISDDYAIKIDLSSLRSLPNAYDIHTFRVNEDEQITIQDAIQQMNDNLGIYIFNQFSRIYFRSIFTSDTYISSEIDDDDLIELDYAIDYDKIINEYSIFYRFSTEKPLTDKDNGNLGKCSRMKYKEKPTKQIDVSQQQNMVVHSRDTAIAIGERYINRFRETIKVLKVKLPIKYYWVSYIGHNYTIRDNVYQLIDKSINVLNNTISCTFWSY